MGITRKNAVMLQTDTEIEINLVIREGWRLWDPTT